MNFKLISSFKPTGDQPQAINKLVTGIKSGYESQVLLGVTGSGKTFTMANVIEKVSRPTLVISHNKTLAAQLYQEFRDFFPQNAVCYFVSYYDFYQPEAYIPQSDTYIEKETEVNEDIDKLRLSATANILSRRDTIVVASVSCIYNLGSPRVYGQIILELGRGVKIERNSIIKRLVDLQYARSDFEFRRGMFRMRGENLDIFPAYEDTAWRLIVENDVIKKIEKIDALTGDILEEAEKLTIYPAKHYITDPRSRKSAFENIRRDLQIRIRELESQGKKLEAQRLNRRVNYDLEMIEELGYVNGIENYSRYFDGRTPGEPPATLLDYFEEKYAHDWLLFIDESHMTVPQIRGMFNGDRSRKQTLVDFGFRLPAAFDNRPLNFIEFMKKIPQTIYVSATPDEWEISHSHVVEQLIRPTGILDPIVSVRSTAGQITDLIREIISRKKKGERVLVTTLTKKTAEDLAAFVNEKSVSENLSVHYLHSDIVTLERSDILDDLREGKYDVLIGINLLREGLDLPEVSLVAILDADKEGFLRSKTSLIQTMGRAARHVNGEVIMYADTKTRSMIAALTEIERRRAVQLKYNKTYGIKPKNIKKPIREKLIELVEDEELSKLFLLDSKKTVTYKELVGLKATELTPYDKSRYIKTLTKLMKEAALALNFELAAEIRDKIKELTNAG